MCIENPTIHERLTINGIIYLIRNIINGKIYIGKAVGTFHKRYPGGKWWIYSCNDHLINAAWKYGIDKFRIIFLETNIETKFKLSNLETFYIKSFNCIYPHGYNYLKGGNSGPLHKITKRKISHAHQVRSKEFFHEGSPSDKEKQSDYFLLKSPVKRIYTILPGGIRKFCRDFGLNRSSIKGIIFGIRSEYNGWSSPSYCFQIKTYAIISPIGIHFTIKHGHIKPFCKEHKLNYSNMMGMIYGYQTHCKGWTLSSTNIEHYPNIQDKLGNIYSIPRLYGSVIAFARIHNLCPSTLSELLSGGIKNHRNFSLSRK